MDLTILMHWAHAVAAVVWVGGLFFLTLVLYPGRLASDQAQHQILVNAAKGVRSWVLAAMVLIVGTGVWRVVDLGGMKALPVLVHIKIALAMVMVLLTLANGLFFLPKLDQALTSGGSAQLKQLSGFQGVVWTALLTAVLGVAVLYLLAQAQLL